MKRPWMPLYVADYIADTAHLSAAQSGAYLHLIMHYWLFRGLPSDDQALCRIAKMSPLEWRKARPLVQAFFTDGWKHGRIDYEIGEAERLSAAGRKGGEASGEARRAKAKALNEGGNGPSSGSTTIAERNANDRSTIPEALHLPLPKETKEDTASAVSSAVAYVFDCGLIRINKKDFDRWRNSFSNLNLAAELESLVQYANEQGPSKWFFAVSGALAKRNREMGLRKEQQKSAPAFKWNGIEGVT
jgi:uncharacterized protein YdaU (DUF1376 family)